MTSLLVAEIKVLLYTRILSRARENFGNDKKKDVILK